MHTASTTIRTLTSALNVPRLLAALALAVALVAIPAVRPDDVGAMRMRELSARSSCLRAGGSVEYNVMDPAVPSVYDMTCTLPTGTSFTCYSGEELFVYCY